MSDFNRRLRASPRSCALQTIRTIGYLQYIVLDAFIKNNKYCLTLLFVLRRYER